jgi:hypothetical protein
VVHGLFCTGEASENRMSETAVQRKVMIEKYVGIVMKYVYEEIFMLQVTFYFYGSSSPFRAQASYSVP